MTGPHIDLLKESRPSLALSATPAQHTAPKALLGRRWKAGGGRDCRSGRNVCTMTKAILMMLALALMTGAASGQQQRTLYNSRGKVVGRSTANGQGTTTPYDASGKVIIRESTTGNTTTIYDASGRNVGHYSANPKR